MSDVIGYFVQCVSHSQASSYFGYREASGFGCQGRRAAHPGIHLNHDLLAVNRIHCELHIGATCLHAHSSHAGKSRISHSLVFHIRQRLRRGNSYAVARVNAHRVKVFNGAHHHAIVGSVAHHLQLELFPADNGFLYQHFTDRAGRETFC